MYFGRVNFIDAADKFLGKRKGQEKFYIIV